VDAFADQFSEACSPNLRELYQSSAGAFNELLNDYTRYDHTSDYSLKVEKGDSIINKLKLGKFEGFNKEQPSRRTVVVSLDLSKAFDTVNIHSLIHKLHQTTLPNTIVKFISNYIKGWKGYTQFKT